MGIPLSLIMIFFHIVFLSLVKTHIREVFFLFWFSFSALRALIHRVCPVRIVGTIDRNPHYYHRPKRQSKAENCRPFATYACRSR